MDGQQLGFISSIILATAASILAIAAIKIRSPNTAPAKNIAVIPPPPPGNEELEKYKETAKLLSSRLKELQQELEETRKYDLRKLQLYCPKDKEYIEPIIASDGRLLCPKCQAELLRIKGNKLEVLTAGLKP